MEVLRLENLSKYYTSDGSVVMGLNEVSLSFSTGEFVAITGESGSGKSTLAHVLGGIIPYESGELYIYGEPTSHYDSLEWERYRRDLVSFISQSYGILPGNTVSENVESALRLGGLSPEEAEKRANEILVEVELDGFKRRIASKLSSGQKQRLSIARALAKPSRILIADEPTGNLDRENSDNVIRLLKRASKDKLVILITHEFEEAKDAATRRIILSDGAVATDARLASVKTDETEKSAPAKKSRSDEKRLKLSPYITYLTIKSRPIFTAILCLLLTVTAFITFVFSGTFIAALDETLVRDYNSNAFFNGDPCRIVVMKDGGTEFTDEDYDKLLATKYVSDIEKWGYTNDINYYYRLDTDYRIYEDVVPGPDYHPFLNPDDFTIQQQAEFADEDPLFLRTLPYVDKDIIKKGRAAEGFYEVISADSEYEIGDTVTVYLRNRTNFPVSSYLKFNFTVVGETSYGEGLYFSDKLASTLTRTVIASGEKYEVFANYSTAKVENCLFIPYDKNSVELYDRDIKLSPENIEKILTDDGFLLPEFRNYYPYDVDEMIKVTSTDGIKKELYGKKIYTSHYSNLFIVTNDTFEAITEFNLPNQVSLYIKDYAYTERVINKLIDNGYTAVSPYKLGSIYLDSSAEIERITTIAICAGALAIAFVLQGILLRAMFGSLNEYFKLLSNMGLTAITAYASLSFVLLIITAVSELLGAIAVLILNDIGFENVKMIFKYLDTGTFILIFALHLLSIGLSLIVILRNLKKNVFATSSIRSDIDLVETEVTAA